MRRTRVAIALLVVAALAAGLTATFITTASAETTLRYNIDFQNSEQSEQPELDMFKGEFILNKGGDRKGHVQFFCIETTNEPPRDVCHGLAQIQGKGQIAVASVQASGASAGATQNVAVTGGTGAFRGARGVMKLNFRDGTVTFVLGD